ncbi:MAG TPA: HD domain-containing phosphohydrolase [Gaiellaceae bacterium]|nr:HD domain-containing phosphohydrolase [Gaiellaceae bacterium]
MKSHGYPPRLYWYIAAVLGIALPVAAGAVVRVALDPPGLSTWVGVILFFGLALLADMKPVPLDVENERVVSLAFVFVVSSQILFGWEYAVLSAIGGVLVSQMVERRPVARSLFNAAVYGLAAFSSAFPVFLLGASSELEWITLYAFVGGALYVIVNIVLVCGALAILAGQPLRVLLRDNLRHSGPAFVIMAFLAALAASLWTTDPWLLVLLAGPLFTLTLYQRSALSTKVATRDALTDSLTGLGNHRSYQSRLREALERAEESGGEVSLCLVDVDEFKGCNDRYGHPLGDQILVELSRLFVEGRDDVAAFRFGGDEFALLLEENEEDAYRFVEDLHERIAQTEFPHGHPVTITVGIASFPGYASSADELQQVADGALYWAKRHGKNRSCVYSPSVVRVYSPNELTELAERQARLRAAENLIRIVDSKDTYTGEHSEAVAKLTEAMARELGLDDETAQQLTLAALLHDLGKIAIPDAVLKKPGCLQPDERRLVRAHVEFGHSLLEGLGIEPVDSWVLHHHEHWDGSGYPDGLAGEDIPFGSRVILVADAYDAMTTDRTYRNASSTTEALAEVRRRAGTQFDPEIVSALERCVVRGLGSDSDTQLEASA